MAPRFHSQLSQCCRLFNNLLMTAINNVSGLGTAGIWLFDWHCFGWMFVVAVRWLVSFICKDIKNLPHWFIYTVHPPSHWRSSTDLLFIRQTDSFWKWTEMSKYWRRVPWYTWIISWNSDITIHPRWHWNISSGGFTFLSIISGRVMIWPMICPYTVDADDVYQTKIHWIKKISRVNSTGVWTRVSGQKLLLTERHMKTHLCF